MARPVMPLITITIRNTHSTHYFLALAHSYVTLSGVRDLQHREKKEIKLCLNHRNEKRDGNKSFDDNFGINRVIFAQICGWNLWLIQRYYFCEQIHGKNAYKLCTLISG